MPLHVPLDMEALAWSMSEFSLLVFATVSYGCFLTVSSYRLRGSWKFLLLTLSIVHRLPRWPSSVQFSHSVVSDSLRLHGLQHARPPCPSPTPGIYSNSCPLSPCCHPTISSSVIPFSSRLQSFPASGSFQISQFFTSGGQSIGVSASASVLPMNNQD